MINAVGREIPEEILEATGKEEISLGEVKKGKNYIFDLTYYHDYYNKEGALQGSTEVSAPTEDKISIDDINIQELSDNIKLETNEYNALINRIRIPVSAEIEDKTIEFTLNITNIQDDKFTQKISVDVGNMIQVKDIKITPIPKSEGAPVDAKVKLYNKTGPIEDTGKEMVIQGDDSQYYTVFKLEIIDEENDSYPISNKLIHYNTIEGAQYGEGLTIIDQNNRENMKSKMTAAYVKVVPVLKEESTYKAITNQGEINNTEYIGITVTEEIKIDAIDIWYNGWYMGEAIEPTDKQSISRMYLVSSFDVDTSHIKQ